MAKEAEKKFYVYIYADPISGVPFYVGKGTNNRAYEHLQHAKNRKTNNPKLAKIRKITRETWQGPVVIIIEEDLSEDEAFSIEKETISFYGRKDLGLGPLLNMSDGGEGSSGREVSKETRARISASNTGKKRTEEQNKVNSERNKGKIIPEHQKQIISKTHKGKIVSEETRRKNSEAHKGIPLTKEHRIKISNSCQNKVWANNGMINTLINKNDIEIYLNQGYELGRKNAKEIARKGIITKNLMEYYKSLFFYNKPNNCVYYEYNA